MVSADAGSGALVPPSTPVRSAPTSLVRRSLDTWLVGGVAVALWCAMVAADAIGVRVPAPGVLVGVAAFVGAMHFAMSYRLAYHHRLDSVRKHPIALAIGPLLLALFLVVMVGGSWFGSPIAFDALQASMSLVFALTMWHYVKQVYGVVRIGARFRGFELTSAEASWLRYGLYPLWFVSLISFASGRTFTAINNFEVRTDLLAGSEGLVRIVLTTVASVVIATVLFIAGRRQSKMPPAMVVVPCVAAVMWVGLTPNMLAAVVLLPALHGLQYLACCYPAQRGLSGYSGRATRSNDWQLAQIFVAAGCAGLLVANFAPNLLAELAPSRAHPGIWFIAVFAFFNLHHYLIDATVWRSRGELVKLVTRGE